jgi:hypothetical protein
VSAGTTVPLAMLWGWSERPVPELCADGYALVMDPNSATILTYQALMTGYAGLKSGAGFGMTRKEILAVREKIQEMIGINALYALEERTVEQAAGAGGRAATP